MGNTAPRRPRPTAGVLRALAALAAAALTTAAVGCAQGGTGPPAPPAAMGAPASAARDVSAAEAVQASASPAGVPPAAAMVCGDEIRDRIAQALALPAVPVPASAWAAGLYTCTYALPGGTLVLSVKAYPDPAAARSYAQAAVAGLPGAAPIQGLANLGLPAYRSSTGTVAFAKDAFALTVDATRLGEPVGPQRTTRTALAYQIATDVLACWSG
ncbi:hypothetical protein [Sinomonas sp.]|uniref:hypothetical protein n=1 Tax=Sinomonas sp. TaxID=1914986 RepID=UPI002FE0E26C